MKMMDTRAYVGMLKELVEQGREVRMVISGSSMAPFLIHGRDSIFFCAPYFLPSAGAGTSER